MTGGMLIQSHAARADGRVLLRVAAGEAALLDVQCSDEDLERCRAFLKGASGSRSDQVRMGSFGPLEVVLARGADDWSVRIFIRAAASDGEAGGDQYVSIQPGRAELLGMIGQPRPSQPVSPPAVPRQLPDAAPAGGSRRRCVLRSAADVRKLALRLFLPRRTPRIVLLFDVFPELEQQRTQTRITRLAEAGQYQYGGPVLAAAVLLLGAAHLIRTLQDDWRYMLWLAIATGSAWLAGRWLGAVWCRLRLQLALLRLWRRVRALERRS